MDDLKQRVNEALNSYSAEKIETIKEEIFWKHCFLAFAHNPQFSSPSAVSIAADDSLRLWKRKWGDAEKAPDSD